MAAKVFEATIFNEGDWLWCEEGRTYLYIMKDWYEPYDLIAISRVKSYKAKHGKLPGFMR